MSKKKPRLKLILDNKTRWNSAYYMLERFLEVDECLNIVYKKNLKTEYPIK